MIKRLFTNGPAGPRGEGSAKPSARETADGYLALRGAWVMQAYGQALLAARRKGYLGTEAVEAACAAVARLVQKDGVALTAADVQRHVNSERAAVARKPGPEARPAGTGRTTLRSAVRHSTEPRAQAPYRVVDGWRAGDVEATGRLQAAQEFVRSGWVLGAVSEVREVKVTDKAGNEVTVLVEVNQGERFQAFKPPRIS